MRALIRAGAVRAGIVYASGAWAEPRVDPRATYRRAAQLASNGAVEDALALPTDLPLLGLNGTVLLSLYDYAGAFTYARYPSPPEPGLAASKRTISTTEPALARSRPTSRSASPEVP
jgi:hypothetical protein